MAIIYEPILNSTTNCGSSGDAFFQPYSINSTNDRFRYNILVFNNGASQEEIFGAFRVPSQYAGSACVVAEYTMTGATGSIVLAFNYRTVASGISGQSFDQTGQTESTSAAFASPSAANLRREAVVPLTSGNFINGDKVQFELIRDPTHATDTAASPLLVHGVYFGYQNS